MEGSKRINKIIFGLICFFVFVLIGFSIYQHQLLKNLSRVENPETILKAASTGNASPEAEATFQENLSENTSSALVQGSQKEVYHPGYIEDLEEQLDATEAELDKAYQQLSDDAARKDELTQKELELRKQYLNSASTRNSFRSSLDRQYADLFEELDLSPEELETFKDIMADRSMMLMKLNLDKNSAITQEQKADLQQQNDEIREEYDSKIEELLGNTVREKYQEYQDKVTSKYFVEGFMDSLSTDEKMTQEQEHDLIEIMYQEQESVFSEIGYDPREIIEFSSDMNDEKIEETMKNMEQIHMKSVESAKDTLSDSQLEQFSDYLENQREIYELSLKLSSTMED